MKKALATIDCVVVGVEVGHGKRHGVLSDYTFAVRERATTLVTIGKAYSGLTDAEIAEMTRWFEAHTIARYGRYPRSNRRWSSSRVRRDRPLEPPPVRVLAALPADRRASARQVTATRSTPASR
jgi:ATP-dependent DNA ligase